MSLNKINQDYLDHQMDGHFSPAPCQHITAYKSKHGTKPFRALQECLRVKPLGRALIRREADEVPRCGSCTKPSAIKSRLYACVACAAVSCQSHAPNHAAELFNFGGGHDIAVDVDRAELFCCVCLDQVYDSDFDALVVTAQLMLSTLKSSVTALVQSQSSPENLRKRRRVDYRPWSPDPRERALMGRNATSLQDVITGNNKSNIPLPRGLRGLNNLGNTCFMNSVLQALLHTPPLRNYFLSDRHNRYFCQQKNKLAKKNGVTNNNSTPLCLACDMDAMFSAAFSGDRMPCSPAKFLYSWWQHAANLASYEQQDAHEFFISMLEAIHEKGDKEKCKLQTPGSGDCCIAHKVFSGILRSDVMCMSCGFTSTTYDPCVDISLDLEPNQKTSTKVASKKFHHTCNDEADCLNSGLKCGVSTLKGCLDRFTRPEKLGSDQKFFCQQCQVRQESLKQMSIRKLPLVSCFHIKRFEHSSVRKMSRKVDRYLQFPFSLNMAPYLSSSILRSRSGNRIFSFDGDSQDSTNGMCSDFELFAVITHSGKLDAGHYVTYLRLSNQWYKCDDAWISQVNESIVRAAQGYMMFYVQKMLFYKASENPAAS